MSDNHELSKDDALVKLAHAEARAAELEVERDRLRAELDAVKAELAAMKSKRDAPAPGERLLDLHRWLRR